jgi:hypothetical protein
MRTWLRRYRNLLVPATAIVSAFLAGTANWPKG